MKNKILKLLIIISGLIVLVGILLFCGADSLIDETTSSTTLLSIFGVIAFRIMTIICTVGLVALIWLIYGIVILIKQIKEGKISKGICICIILASIGIIYFGIIFIKIMS